MRSTEDAKDYRYFPDPDLPPIDISIASAAQPELKKAKSRRYLGVRPDMIPPIRRLQNFENTIKAGAAPNAIKLADRNTQ